MSKEQRFNGGDGGDDGDGDYNSLGLIDRVAVILRALKTDNANVTAIGLSDTEGGECTMVCFEVKIKNQLAIRTTIPAKYILSLDLETMVMTIVLMTISKSGFELDEVGELIKSHDLVDAIEKYFKPNKGKKK